MVKGFRAASSVAPGRSAGFAAIGAYVVAICGSAALALDTTPYSATVNDRFTSGFPTNPVPNTSGSFVGSAYDWSGVGWENGFPTKGFGFISPQHYLVAKHYGGAATITVQGADGTLRNVNQASVIKTGYGVVLDSGPDLSIGRLTAPIPADCQVARYAVLDLNASSTVNSSYNSQPLFVYGRGANDTNSPRIGPTTINGTVLSGSNSYVTSSLTSSTSVQLQVGDSGSPIFIPWTNPVGGNELTILGNNAAYDATSNFYNYLANSAVMSAVNGLTTPDGYALRVRGNINALWTGSVSSSLWTVGNWNGNPVDQYAGFQAGGSTPTAINVANAANIRGLYFGGTGDTNNGFTFSGSQTLTIGRGGLTNYDTSRQTFNAAIALGDHQYWNVAPGGVTANAISTDGKLLELAGSGTTRITGVVSGSGGLALSGHRLELTGSSSYTGGTWVHAGTLVVNGTIAASSGVSLDAGAVLGGSGRVSGISGSGLVGPGNSPGILTAPSVNPAGGLDFAFELAQEGAPTWGNANASGNDVLRLTDATTPFATSLSAANAINVYLAATSLAYGDTFQGGFFTDKSANFLASVQNATFTYYVLGNGLGTDAVYNGQGYYLLDTDFWPSFDEVLVSTVGVASATFADATVTNGQVMQFAIVPEPTGLALAAIGVLGAVTLFSRRRLV